MSLFKKFFGQGSDAVNEERSKGDLHTEYKTDLTAPPDERFTFNFKKNGGKFLYCENLDEVKEQFENILEENDWFECEAMCFEPRLFHLLDENKLSYNKPTQPKFLLASCENLIAHDGSIMLSYNQTKHFRPDELPANIVILATTSQITESSNDGLRLIKKKYGKDIPSNITAIRYFEQAKEENFNTYGSAAKNLYLLLLEDL